MVVFFVVYNPDLWHMFNRYDWLPIIVQFSKICTSLHTLSSKCFINWRLDYCIKSSSFRQVLFL